MPEYSGKPMKRQIEEVEQHSSPIEQNSKVGRQNSPCGAVLSPMTSMAGPMSTNQSGLTTDTSDFTIPPPGLKPMDSMKVNLDIVLSSTDAPPWASELGSAILKGVREELNILTHSVTFAQSEAHEAKVKSGENEEKIGALESQVKKMQIDNNRLSKKIIDVESQSRRSNLKIFGVPRKEDENLQEWITSFLKDNLKIENPENIEIERIHRLPGGNPQPIIVKFLRFGDRQNIWKSRRNLAGTSFTLAEDFPAEIEQERRKLVPIMKAAKNMKMEAYMNVNKLYINKQMYTVQTLHQLPKRLQPEQLSIVKDKKYTFFFGAGSALSNFHPAPFFLDGHSFNCTEQYLQWVKARMFRDQDTAEAILKAENPVEQKRLGRQVSNFENEKWKEEGPERIKRGLLEKFRTHSEMKAFLKDTGATELVECSKTDNFFGIGLPLHGKDKFDKENGREPIQWEHFSWKSGMK